MREDPERSDRPEDVRDPHDVPGDADDAEHDATGSDRSRGGESGRAEPGRTVSGRDVSRAPAVVVRDPTGPGIGALLYRGIGLLFLLGLTLLHFHAITRVLLLGFVSAIVAVALNKVVERLPVPRSVGAPLTALVFLGGLAAAIYFIGTEVARQLRLFLEQLPGLWEQVLEWQGRLREETGLDISLVGERAVEVVRELPTVLRQAIGLLEIVALVLLVVIGAFYVVAEPNRRLLTPLMRAIPPVHRPAFYRAFHLLGERLGQWLWGSLISMAIIGTLSTAALYLLGAPYPLLLGVMIGLLEVIPMVGPWIGGIAAVIITLVHDPGLAMWVALVVLGIQELEGNVIHPVVMRGAVSVHPFVTLMALILFSAMFGILGAILSLPLVLALQTIARVFWVEERLHAEGDEVEPVVKDHRARRWPQGGSRSGAAPRP